jgi:hypothetical protein
MRDLSLLETYCLQHGDDGGYYQMPSPLSGDPMVIIASYGMDWDHVSVSLRHRCPNWPEMEFVKRRFFKDDETVMQLHVPSSEHINCHPYCLHLWRPQRQEIPRPPADMVGPQRKAG